MDLFYIFWNMRRFFKSIHADISIGAVFINSEIRKIAEQEGFKLYKINNVPIDVEYDLVYALHLCLFPYLPLKGLTYKYSILGLLSLKDPIEQLPPSFMYPYFDLITTISPEIIAHYQDDFHVDSSMFTLIPNPIPLEFIVKSSKKKSWSNKIAEVNVVSNHKLPELIEMAQSAPWKTDFFGSEYGNSVNITPELLSDYDAIITIGKTVQYGMGLGVPIFEYDHNGGYGWIIPENLETEAQTNFSGRSSCQKRDAQTLIRDIETGDAETAAQADILRKKALEKFSIIKLITIQLKTVLARPPKGKPILSLDAWFYCNTCYLAIDHIMDLQKIRAVQAGGNNEHSL